MDSELREHFSKISRDLRMHIPRKRHSIAGSRNSGVQQEGTEPHPTSPSSASGEAEEVLPCGPDTKFQHVGGHEPEVPRVIENGPVTDHNSRVMRRESMLIEDAPVVGELTTKMRPERDLIVSKSYRCHQYTTDLQHADLVIAPCFTFWLKTS